MHVIVSVPEGLYRRAEEAARREGISVSDLYARALEDHLAREARRSPVERSVVFVGSTPVMHCETADALRTGQRRGWTHRRLV